MPTPELLSSAELLPRTLAVLALEEQQPKCPLWGSGSLNEREQIRVQACSEFAGGT